MTEKTDMKLAIKEKIFSLVDEFSPKNLTLSDEDSIVESGLLDSAGIFELICWYEEHFQIQLSNEEINQKNLGTITSMVDFIFIKRAGNA